MAEGATGSMIDARFGCALCTVVPCAESCASPNFGAVSCFRTASQRMLIRDTIDRTPRVGSAVVVACPWGVIPACRDRVCVYARAMLRVQACQELTFANCPAHQRIVRDVVDTFLRSLGSLLIIPMSRYNFTMYSFEIFTPPNVSSETP